MADKFVYGQFKTLEEVRVAVDHALKNSVTIKDITVVGSDIDEFDKEDDHYGNINTITYADLRVGQAEDAEGTKDYKEFENVDIEALNQNHDYLVLIDSEFKGQLRD